MTRESCPVVSIGMPVFNDERFLRESLDSLLTQSFNDFELIISDNASADRTGEICREYAAKDSRVRYIRQPSNIGGLANFNFLLNEAQGEYFMWAASDDRWHSEFIATLVEAMRLKPECVTAFAPYVFVDEKGRPAGEPVTLDYSGRSASERLLKFCFYYDDAFVYGLHKREAIREVRFRAWWWLNSKTAKNSAYPVVCYLLARGDYALAGTEPLWFNRVYFSSGSISGRASRHRRPRSRLVGYLAFLLRKINLLSLCLGSVYSGSRSIIATLVASPILTGRCLYDFGRVPILHLRSAFRMVLG
jgi:glycosyltransferase involved in cell wall biosynthesis